MLRNGSTAIAFAGAGENRFPSVRVVPGTGMSRQNRPAAATATKAVEIAAVCVTRRSVGRESATRTRPIGPAGGGSTSNTCTGSSMFFTRRVPASA